MVLIISVCIHSLIVYVLNLIVLAFTSQTPVEVPTPDPGVCQPNPCKNGVCTPLRDGYHCSCRPGKNDAQTIRNEVSNPWSGTDDQI